MEPQTYQPPGYETDLSDAEWELLKPLIFLPELRRGRDAWRDPNSARACLDAIRYVLKTGCQWSLSPREFAPQGKAAAKKNATPSAAVIDSQSVKGGQLPALSCGYDAGKKIKGRKRHALTDTNGLLLGVVVTPARA